MKESEFKLGSELWLIKPLGLGLRDWQADLTADTSVSDQAAQLGSKRVTSMQNIAAAARCCWEDTGKAWAISCQP